MEEVGPQEEGGGWGEGVLSTPYRVEVVVTDHQVALDQGESLLEAWGEGEIPLVALDLVEFPHACAVVVVAFFQEACEMKGESLPDACVKVGASLQEASVEQGAFPQEAHDSSKAALSKNLLAVRDYIQRSQYLEALV